MLSRARRLLHAVRRFGRANAGASAVEFALIAPLFFLFLFGIIELALVFLLSTSMENATSVASRMIRTGQHQTGGGSATSFKQNLCANLGWLAADCASKLAVDVRTFQTFDSVNMPSPVSNGNYDPSNMMFQAGGPHDIVVVRAYYQWGFITPLIGQAMQQLSNGSMLVATTHVFRNEPYGT